MLGCCNDAQLTMKQRGNIEKETRLHDEWILGYESWHAPGPSSGATNPTFLTTTYLTKNHGWPNVMSIDYSRHPILKDATPNGWVRAAYRDGTNNKKTRHQNLTITYRSTHTWLSYLHNRRRRLNILVIRSRHVLVTHPGGEVHVSSLRPHNESHRLRLEGQNFFIFCFYYC